MFRNSRGFDAEPNRRLGAFAFSGTAFSANIWSAAALLPLSLRFRSGDLTVARFCVPSLRSLSLC